MSTAAAKLLIFAGEKFACLRIIGRANVTTSVDFRSLMNELRQRGYNYFVLDLSECALMDSTFLGVLSGFGLKLRSSQTDPDKLPIELVNANARITELLENLGVLHLFKLTEGGVTATCQPTEHTPANPTKEEITRACLEAHRTLMDINPGNRAKFKEVAAFLAEDLKKSKREP
jgi:anti-anti-sigma regulatory factor